MSFSSDPHAILGLVPPCSPTEIRKAYLKAAIACHPDRHPNDKQATQKFQAVSQAYQTLSQSPNEHDFHIPFETDEIRLDNYKAMFEHIAAKARVFLDNHQTEIRLVKSVFKSFTSNVIDNMYPTAQESQ